MLSEMYKKKEKLNVYLILICELYSNQGWAVWGVLNLWRAGRLTPQSRDSGAAGGG